MFADLACKRGRDSAQAGAVGPARAAVEAAIAALDRIDPSPKGTLIACLADASAIARLGGDGARAIATAERIRDLEVDAGIARTATHADTLLILARAYALAGRFADAAATAERGMALHAALGTVQTPAANNLRAILATIWRDGGQPARALVLQDALLAEHAARGGAARTLASVVSDRALVLSLLGRPDEALPVVTAALEDARARGDAALTRASAVERLRALVGSGQLVPARKLADETAAHYAVARTERSYLARRYLIALAELALAEGDLAAGQRAIDEVVVILNATGGPRDPAMRAAHALGARLALARGEFDTAHELAELTLVQARAEAIDAAASLFVGEGLVLRSQARAGRGDAAGARADARDAADVLRGTVGATHWLTEQATRLGA